MASTAEGQAGAAVARAERAAVPAIMVVAGEASGDLHGAALCRALRGLNPGCRLVGMGGARMAEAGLIQVADVTGVAAVGFVEVAGRLGVVWRAYRALRRTLRETRPQAVVVIDFPEFNLRLARAARRAGVPVVYFVPPQLWAWRGGRIRTMRKRVALVLAVFPFEEPLYRRAGVAVRFVGHPLLDQVAGAPPRAEARARLGVPAAGEVVALLPGSRQGEIERMLPPMREAVERLAAERPRTRFLLALAPTVDRGLVERLLGASLPVTCVSGDAHAVLRAADVALVTSGTATLEAALLGTPMVVGYRLTAISEAITRLLVRVPWISLPNLILGRAVVPELYRRQATGAGLAFHALRLLDDPEASEAQRAAFAELAGVLGEPGVAMRAARLVSALADRGR